MAAVGATAERAIVIPPPKSQTRSRAIRAIGRSPVHLFLLLVAIAWIIPAAGLLVTSLLPPGIAASEGWWKTFSKPSQLTFENYRKLLVENDTIRHALIVTVEVTIGATILPIIVAALAAYAFAWLEFPGREVLFLVVVGLLLVPIQMALIPIFKLYNSLGLYDTVLGLILFHTAFALPFAILLLRNFFAGIPRDLMEASRIDGAGPLRFFWDTLLPLSRTNMAALFVILFILGWNQYLWPLLITTRDDMQTIQVGIRKMITTTDALTEWPIVMATAVLAMLPPVFVVVVMQKLFVRGLVETEK